MEGHEAFKGTISVSLKSRSRRLHAYSLIFKTRQTNILVECPPGCAEAAAATVFGSDGIYAESSAICKAGIHAGLIKSGGVFSVSIESPIYSFEGSKQNGVESKSLQLPPGDAIRSMRVFKIEEVRTCLFSSLQKNFIQNGQTGMSRGGNRTLSRLHPSAASVDVFC